MTSYPAAANAFSCGCRSNARLMSVVVRWIRRGTSEQLHVAAAERELVEARYARIGHGAPCELRAADRYGGGRPVPPRDPRDIGAGRAQDGAHDRSQPHGRSDHIRDQGLLERPTLTHSE